MPPKKEGICEFCERRSEWLQYRFAITEERLQIALACPACMAALNEFGKLLKEAVEIRN